VGRRLPHVDLPELLLEVEARTHFTSAFTHISERDAAIGEILGPGFSRDGVVDAVETVVDTYLGLRREGENFLGTYGRTGPAPFKEAVYGAR